MSIYSISNFRYTDSEVSKLMDSIVVLIDTREQKNQHITDYFDENNIMYEKCKLDSADYSFMLPQNEELGIIKDMYFDKSIVIERKNSLEELSSCFSQTRVQFNNEWYRCVANRKYLVIENASYSDILRGNYDTKYNPKSFLASIHSFGIKHHLQIMFMPDKKYTPIYILETCRYYLRYIIKEGDHK